MDNAVVISLVVVAAPMVLRKHHSAVPYFLFIFNVKSVDKNSQILDKAI